MRSQRACAAHRFRKETAKDTHHDLAQALSPYDPADILCAVGALSLMPENASRGVRLETLAGVAASARPALGTAAMRRGHLHALLNTGPLAAPALTAREDPPENPFTEEVAFYSGSFLALPGRVPEAAYVLRHLVGAIFLHPDPFPDVSYRDGAYTLVLGALALIDTATRRAGLVRHLDPFPDEGRPRVVVPSWRRLARLKRAVTFDWAEVAHLLAAYELPPEALDPLITRPGSQDGAQGHGNAVESLRARPLVACDAALILALPDALLAAIRHALLDLARRHGVTDELARRYRDVVWHDAMAALDEMDIRPLGVPTLPLEIAGAVDGLFELDVDKLLYVVLVTDTLAAYDAHTPHGAWPVGTLVARIRDRLRRVRGQILRAHHPPRGLLSLVLVQGVGRAATMRFPEPPRDDTRLFLALSAADLHTIALLEPRDPLALWAFARAIARVRRQADVIAMAALDEFYAYRAAGYTFPPAPESATPMALCMPIAGAGELRREALHVHDRHGAPFFGGVLEVTAAHDPAQPIYTPVDSGGSRVAYLVEGAPVPVWCVSPPLDGQTTGPHVQRYLYLTNTMAYWLWQCAPTLRRLLRPVVGRHEVVYLTLHLATDEGDDGGTISGPLTAEEAIAREVDATGSLIALHAQPGVERLFEGPDNSGDRVLVHHLLHALRDLLPPGTRERWSDEALASAVDRHAPLGPQKRFMALDSAYTPDLDPTGLPVFTPPRVLHLPTLQDLRHDLWPRQRAWIAATARAGGASKEQWGHLLKETVAACFDELVRLVASLDPDGVLETLVAQHEALVRERALGRLNVPAAQLGLAQVPEVVARERDTYERAAHAAVAARFVIEYAVARPPSGHLPLSLGTYDRLQALATTLIEAGAESDAIHYDLIAVGDAPLTPDAFAEKRAAFRGGMEGYRAASADGDAVRWAASFADHWPAPLEETDNPSPLMAEIDAAARVEWGLALTDVRRLIAEVWDIGRGIDPVVAVMEHRALAERLSAMLSWPHPRVARALELLSLTPRPDYLIPPDGYGMADVYPWRYNRRLSYLRRPLLLRSARAGATEVVWGPRHLATAEGYLVDVVLSGRLQARTAEMGAVLRRLRDRRGHAFNDAVVEAISAHGTVVVLPRVKKMGCLDGLARHLGDVDVLVADPVRRRLWVIECKSFVAARMPHELQGELYKLLIGWGNHRSTVDKHVRRAAYLRDNLPAVIGALGLGDAEGWTVEPLVVVDQELATPYLRASPIPVIPFHVFKEWIATWD